MAIKTRFVALAFSIIGFFALVTLMNMAHRSGYEALAYDKIGDSEFLAYADYSEIVARNTIEVGFTLEERKSKVVLFQLFFSDVDLPIAECKQSGTRFKCYQHVSLKQGDKIHKKRGENLLCSNSHCYALVAPDDKAELGEQSPR